MSYITPNSTVILCKNVPLDSKYNDTIYFSSADNQYSYFASLASHTFTGVSYQRVGKGSIRLEVVADDIYNCNYMMFQNTSFGSKWFYAFIDRVEYVNNITSEIFYTIDVLQTWFFEATLGSCFVEREHSSTDVIGDNITPEGLECGEYVANSYSGMSATIDEGTYSLSDLCVVVSMCDTENYVVSVTLTDGIVSGSTLIAYPLTTAGIAGVESLVKSYVDAGTPDAITGMYMLPILALGFYPDSGGSTLTYNTTTNSYVWTLSAISLSNSLDGYTPKNNKLYTYPYSFLGVDNASGESMIIRYEFCDNLTPMIGISVNTAYPIIAIARPFNYLYSGITGENNRQNITLSQYPQCSWNADYYTAWVAQNSVPLAINAGSSTLNTAANAITSVANTALSGLLGGNSQNANIRTEQSVANASVSSGVSGLNYISNLLSSAYTASIHADITKGTYNAGNQNCASGKQNFYAGRYSVSAQYARQIDDYFSRYGYATHIIKVPNRNVRPYWTYTKTVDCVITGSLPADDKAVIESIYDRGITFWANGSYVGNYSLDNSL